jgi:hypothetical protein
LFGSLSLYYSAGLSRHISECLDRSTYPVEQTRPCNTDCVGEWTMQVTGLWSDCILTTRPTAEMMSAGDLTPAVADSLPKAVNLSVDGVGLLHATDWNCGIGHRYHSTVCHNSVTGQNVSSAECSAKGT